MASKLNWELVGRFILAFLISVLVLVWVYVPDPKLVSHMQQWTITLVTALLLIALVVIWIGASRSLLNWLLSAGIALGQTAMFVAALTASLYRPADAETHTFGYRAAIFAVLALGFWMHAIVRWMQTKESQKTDSPQARSDAAKGGGCDSRTNE